MQLYKTNTSRFRLFIREIIGLYRFFKAKKKYLSINHPVYLSDHSKSSIKQNENESFDSFFMRVEKIRDLNKNKISKNVQSSLTYFSTASELIPFLISKCNLKTTNKVLDYGSGGLRCGFGLLDFLNTSSEEYKFAIK